MSTAMQKLLAAAQKAKQTSGNREDDDVFYYPVRDAAGNGSAVIRFLRTNEDEVPFITIYSHGFKGPTNKWLIENCPTTLENDCPVCAANSELYAKMSKDDARKHGMNRKKSFISRIVVVEDKKTPENEGKVFLYKYGTKVFDKIFDKIQPEFEDDKACDVFDLKEGANFKLKIRKVDNQTNYDKSEFDSPSECELEVDSQLNDENDIQKFLKPENFKSAELLQKRLDLVLGNSLRVAPIPAAKAKLEDDGDDDMPFDGGKPVKETKKSKAPKVEQEDDDDDIMRLVKSLSEDD